MAGICEGECMGRSPVNEPLTLTAVGCHNYMRPLKGGSFFIGLAYNLIYFFSFIFKALFLFYNSSFLGMKRTDPVVAGGGKV